MPCFLSRAKQSLLRVTHEGVIGGRMKLNDDPMSIFFALDKGAKDIQIYFDITSLPRNYLIGARITA